MPKNPERDTFAEFAAEQLASLGDITARPMMGGRTLYCDGIVFALIAAGELYLKADDANRFAFTDRGWPAFRPDPDQPGTMSYYLVPASVLEDRDELTCWAGEAVAAGRRSREKKGRKPKTGVRGKE